ncbi:hypothetical protein Ancab_001533 [Ancistrocladus abbreviatus]
MTTLTAAFHSLPSINKTNPAPCHHQRHHFPLLYSYSSCSTVSFQKYANGGRPSLQLRLGVTQYKSTRENTIRSVAEETQIPEEQPGAEEQIPSESEQTVSVPVSPSDKLIMYFQAEGTISETAIPAVTKALEEREGISDLKVQVSEGIASVELMKQTTIQATGVASGLVETIQGSGFKLQTLNLSFEDEEEILS